MKNLNKKHNFFERMKVIKTNSTIDNKKVTHTKT